MKKIKSLLLALPLLLTSCDALGGIIGKEDPTYTVKWVVEGQTVETDEKVKEGTIPTFDGATPTKESTAQFTYTFSMWSPQVGAIEGDTTYTAMFEETLNTYTIKFVDDEGTVLQTSEVGFGLRPEFLGAEDPVKEVAEEDLMDIAWYEFDGWDRTIVAVTGPATYTAKFTAVTTKELAVDYCAVLSKELLGQEVVQDLWSQYQFVGFSAIFGTTTDTSCAEVCEILPSWFTIGLGMTEVYPFEFEESEQDYAATYLSAETGVCAFVYVYETAYQTEEVVVAEVQFTHYNCLGE